MSFKLYRYIFTPVDSSYSRLTAAAATPCSRSRCRLLRARQTKPHSVFVMTSLHRIGLEISLTAGHEAATTLHTRRLTLYIGRDDVTSRGVVPVISLQAD